MERKMRKAVKGRKILQKSENKFRARRVTKFRVIKNVHYLKQKKAVFTPPLILGIFPKETSRLFSFSATTSGNTSFGYSCLSGCF